MSTDFEKLVENVFQVFAVEHWARFYYAVDKGGDVYLEIPEEALAQTEKTSPALVAFLREINHQKTDFETSQRQVGEFAFKIFEESLTAEGRLIKLFDSPEFRIQSRLFSLWLAGHEGLLDQREYSFAEWGEMFGQWRKAEQVQRYAASLGKQETIPDPEKGSVN